MLSTLAPNKTTKIRDVINESASNSSNRAIVNPTGYILCTINNNFVNTANFEFFKAAGIGIWKVVK